MKIYLFYDRIPNEISRQAPVELQFYEACPVNDVTEEVEEESVTKARAYYKKFLPWREEFNQVAETDEDGNVIQEDYILSNKTTLFNEAKYVIE